MQIKDIIPWARRDQEPETKGGQSNPLVSLRQDVNEVLENFWHRFGEGLGSLDWPFGGGDTKSDVVETDKAIEVSIELPGMDMKDIEVTVSNDLLTVKGEKKIERQEEKKGYYLSERSYGAVYRTIPLPPGVDGEKAEASLHNGVLTVTLPQSAEVRRNAKRIEVKSA